MSDAFLLGPSMRFDDRMEMAPEATFEIVSSCSLYPDHADRRMRTPLKVIVPVTPRYDFQWTVYKDCVVSGAVRRVLEKHHLSGIAFRPIEASLHSGIGSDQELYEMHATGWGGMVSANSDLAVSEYCTVCGRAVFTAIGERKMKFDIDAWDGSDGFMIWPFPKHLVVSSAVKSIIEREEWTGLDIHPFDDLKINETGSVTPDIVSSWIEGLRGRRIQTEIDGEITKRYLAKEPETN